jgi:hypothetical protein
MTEKTITEFLSNEYKEFSLYVIENRAIPSVIDGLKPSQRKIIHICNQIWKTGSEKPLKVFQLSGAVANQAFYHHGDCLSPETEIVMSDGHVITILEWYEKYPDCEFDLVSYDEVNGEFVCGKGHSPRIGSITDVEYEIIMDDDSVFKCTGNHPFYTQRGWIKAEDLLNTDEIKSFYDTP